MTQDEIIEMAKQFCPYYSEELRGAYYDGFMKASKLVAQHERESCAKVCDELQDVPATEPRHCAEDIRARGKA